MTAFRQLLKDPRVVELLSTLGTPYDWAVGDPNDTWPPTKCDCSGFTQMALVYLKMLKSTEVDRNAMSLANICDAVTDEPRLGDLAFYARPVSHVMLVLNKDWVIGATGGTSATNSDNPEACVQLRRLRYRKDLTVVGRLKVGLAP